MNLPKLDCGGCTRCCRGDTITVFPDEPHKRWKTDFKDGWRTLRKGADGNCIYLGKSGCTIHGKQPKQCRAYDCRVHFMIVMQREGEAGIEKRLAMKPDSGLVEGRRRCLQPHSPP